MNDFQQTGERVKAVAKAAQSLFNEDGTALVPLKEQPEGEEPVPLEETFIVVGKSTVEKTVKRLLWNNRDCQCVKTGGGAVVVVKDGADVVVGLCDLEVARG